MALSLKTLSTYSYITIGTNNILHSIVATFRYYEYYLKNLLDGLKRKEKEMKEKR